MTLFKLDLDLQNIKEQYSFLKDLGLDNESQYIKHHYYKAFSKNKAQATTSLAYLIVFFAFKCEKFEVVSPKDEFGLQILNIADLYEQNKKVSQEKINEALSALLLECYKNEIFYEKALYQILNDYVNNRSVLDPVPVGNCDMPNLKTKEGLTPEIQASLSQFDKTYVMKNGVRENYNPVTATNFQKLQVAQEIGEYKNNQVKERAIKAFKILNNCEPTKDEAEKAKALDKGWNFDNTTYTKASARILNIGR